MSTRDCSPQRMDRVDPRESRERPPEMSQVDRVSLLREGACINRYISAAAERFLPNVTIDQRFGGNYICVDNNSGNGRDISFDPRRGRDPRYGGDPRMLDPRNGGDPRMLDPRNGGDPRMLDPRTGGDPRMFDPRNGGDPRMFDPRSGGDPRLFDPRNGGDPRLADPRQRQYDDPSNAPGDGQMRDHTVQKGDSLWKIARNALRESGQPAGARDIMNAIQSIVEANKAEHPSLAKNPNLILDGWHLKIPCGGQDAANRDGRNQDLYGYGGDRRDNRSSDFYQYGGDRGRTRYGGGDAYFDQRDGAYGNPGPYDRNPNPYRGNPYDRNPYDRNPYDRNPYDRGQYDQNSYQRDPYNRNPYERPPGYNQDASNQPLNQLSMALKDAALMAARGMGTIGRCAAGVQVALARIGHSQFMGSGNAWDMGSKMANSGKFDVLPLSQAREGDVIVRSWNRSVINQHGGRNWGDIVVVTSKDGRGNLMGANDHHGRIPPDGGRYCNSYVLRCRA